MLLNYGRRSEVAIKVGPTATIKTAFLVMALHQKLMLIISHIVKPVSQISMAKKFSKFFVHSIIKTVVTALLSNYRTTGGALIRKERVSTQTVQVQ